MATRDTSTTASDGRAPTSTPDGIPMFTSTWSTSAASAGTVTINLPANPLNTTASLTAAPVVRATLQCLDCGARMTRLHAAYHDCPSRWRASRDGDLDGAAVVMAGRPPEPPGAPIALESGGGA